MSNDSPGRRSLGERWFLRRRPAIEKLLSPSLAALWGNSDINDSLQQMIIHLLQASKCDFSYSYVAIDKISTDIVRRAVPLR